MPIRRRAWAVPRVAMILKPRSSNRLAIPVAAELVAVGDGEKDRAVCGQPRSGRGLSLGERGREVGRDPHHLAGRAHLGTQQRVGAGEAVKRQHRLLDAHVRAIGLVGQSEVGDPLAEHDPARQLGQRQPDRLGHERHRSRRPRVGFDDVQPVVAVDGKLDVEQADHTQGLGDPGGLLADLIQHRRAERVRGQDASRVPGVDAGLLDVLHDPGDPHV